MRNVAIVLKAIPHYRVPFLERLRKRLQSDGVRLQVIYGQVEGRDAEKKHTVDLPWGLKIRNRVIHIGSKDLYWQACLGHIRDADLVIVMQEAKLLLNTVLWIRQPLGGASLAFWGHGRDFQFTGRWSISEWLKRLMSRRVHWWFAYTERSREALRRLGFPDSRITVVNNALDTQTLADAVLRISREDLEALRQELGIEGEATCIFAGSLTRERNMRFLLEAVRFIREEVPSFELIILGTGPEERAVMEAASALSWIKMVGPKFGVARVPYFALAKLLLIPGMVGLHVQDSFAMGVPLVTLDLPTHSPEIAYLADGANGRLLPSDASPRAYAAEVARLLRNETDLQTLRQGCRRSSGLYSIEDMSARFADGVLAALAAP